jgi:hypothetical protein
MMDLELSGDRVAATSLRSRIREFIRTEVAAETARLCDARMRGDHNGIPEIGRPVLLCAGGHGSLTQITVVPPSTTNSWPLT